MLEDQQEQQANLNKKLIKYYTNNNITYNINDNAGAGSVVLNKNQDLNVSAFIKKVGLPYKYGLVLENIVNQYNCTKSLELGTSLGISTSFIASNTNNTVTTIEANKAFYNITKKAFRAQKVDNVQFVNAYFDEVLEDVCKRNKPFSLVFIDGDHTKKATIKNFNTIKPYLSENSIVILDDIYWSKEMTAAWHEVKKDKDISVSIDLFRIGLLFFRKEKHKKEHFTLWY